jgi:hypothetical protein
MDVHQYVGAQRIGDVVEQLLIPSSVVVPSNGITEGIVLRTCTFPRDET